MFRVKSITFNSTTGEIQEVISDEDFGALKTGQNDGDFERDRKYVELMQFTGLQDSKGVDIYDSDLIQWNGDGAIVEVVWNEKRACYYAGNIKHLTIPEANRWEVVGNRWENPDLLEKGAINDHKPKHTT
jgi:hypothetical protein